MPIKFRCQHCQQLLGISRSRAGAIVDCPQCGRSLRVPELDGTTQSVPDEKQTAHNDAALQSALSELSSLSQLSEVAAAEQTDTVEDTTAAEATAAAVQPAVTPTAETAEPVAAEPLAPSQPVTIAPSETPQIIEPAQDDLAEYTVNAPATLAEQLASVIPPDSQNQTSAYEQSVVAEYAADQSNRVASWTTPLLGAVLTVSAFAMGWWYGHSITGSPPSATQSDSPAAADPAAVAGNNAMPNGAGTNGTEHILHGSVRYQSDTDAVLPDNSAIILLLPGNRRGTLLLDGRSLRREADHPDRLATLAALHELGGAMVEADDQGHFAVMYDKGQDYSLIAISRHVQREPGSEPTATIQNIIRQYFGTDGHLPGKLAATSITIQGSSPLSEPLEITISKTP